MKHTGSQQLMHAPASDEAFRSLTIWPMVILVLVRFTKNIPCASLVSCVLGAVYLAVKEEVHRGEKVCLLTVAFGVGCDGARYFASLGFLLEWFGAAAVDYLTLFCRSLPL